MRQAPLTLGECEGTVARAGCSGQCLFVGNVLWHSVQRSDAVTLFSNAVNRVKYSNILTL